MIIREGIHTTVYAEDQFTDFVPHNFIVADQDGKQLADIHFQEGIISQGVNGVTNEDLLAMAICRLEHFQESPYKCRENAIAITKLQEALMWLEKRTQDRVKRSVEGTHKL